MNLDEFMLEISKEMTHHPHPDKIIGSTKSIHAILKYIANFMSDPVVQHKMFDIGLKANTLITGNEVIVRSSDGNLVVYEVEIKDEKWPNDEKK